MLVIFIGLVLRARLHEKKKRVAFAPRSQLSLRHSAPS
jgi:hypothetical protein